MRFIPLLALAVLTACSTAEKPAEALGPAPSRELSKTEKDRLRTSLARSLPQPGTAQFKWVPVVLRERDGGTDYCGLVNAKLAQGSYAGFTPFFAQLRKGPGGDFDSGDIKLLANPSDAGAIVATASACRTHGYADITGAR